MVVPVTDSSALDVDLLVGFHHLQQSSHGILIQFVREYHMRRGSQVMMPHFSASSYFLSYQMLGLGLTDITVHGLFLQVRQHSPGSVSRSLTHGAGTSPRKLLRKRNCRLFCTQTSRVSTPVVRADIDILLSEGVAFVKTLLEEGDTWVLIGLLMVFRTLFHVKQRSHRAREFPGLSAEERFR